MRLWIVRAAFKEAMRHPLPERIPMSDRQLIAERQYTGPYLSTATGQRVFYGEELKPNGIQGKWFETQNAPGENRLIPNSELLKYRVEFTEYIAELEFTYSSALEYLIHQWLGIPRLRLWRERATQFLYNQKRLVKADRMKVLKHFHQRTLENDQYRTDAQNLLSEFHGPRWARNDANMPLYDYQTLVLDSLVETGDLSRDDRGYVLRPQALVTLERAEDEFARHREQARLQMILILVTAVLALVRCPASYFRSVRRRKTSSCVVQTN